MENKGLLHNMGGWSQFFFFCFLAFFGMIAATFVLAMSLNMDNLWQSANTMRLAQAIQTIIMFLCSALAFAYLCHGNVKSYFKVEIDVNFKYLLLAVVLIIALQPLVYAVSYYNHQLVLPDFLAPLENWMKEKEVVTERIMNLLFEKRTITELVFNLLVIAVVAGLAEEFFFRGCIQQIIQKIVNNPHTAVWIAAIIFSVMHFQFYGFVPRVLLGALLGYLYIWSGNIWVPVIIHTIHNAINIVIAFVFYNTEMYVRMENFNLVDNTLFIIPSAFLSSVALFILYRKKIIAFKN